MKRLPLVIIFVVIFTTLLPYSLVRAVDFNPNYIISDEEMVDSSALTLVEIQDFLARNNSALTNMRFVDVDGLTRSSAEIIHRASLNYRINPKVILVTLQKEASLIQSSVLRLTQLDWAMGYSVCDSCSISDPSVVRNRGFAVQVDKAAALFRWYFDNPTAFRRANVEYSIDGTVVKPATQATANLYSYTPHLHGNYLFWTLWQRWFKQYYPDSSLLKTADSGTVWLVELGQKRAFKSMSALISRFDPTRIITVPRAELDKYETGSLIAYPNFSLLRDENKNIYLLVHDELKRIDNTDTFRYLGFDPSEVVDVKNADIVDYPRGAEISMTSAYPLGALLQDSSTGGVFYVQSGVKHPLIAKEIMQINYAKYPIQVVSSDELSKYPQGDTIKFREGELLKSPTDPRVYLISAGYKCPIADEKVFNTLGFKWSQIKVVSEKSLSNLELGSEINLTYKK